MKCPFMDGAECLREDCQLWSSINGQGLCSHAAANNALCNAFINGWGAP